VRQTVLARVKSELSDEHESSRKQLEHHKLWINEDETKLVQDTLFFKLRYATGEDIFD